MTFIPHVLIVVYIVLLGSVPSAAERTNCNRQALLFSSLGHKKNQVDFNGGANSEQSD